MELFTLKRFFRKLHETFFLNGNCHSDNVNSKNKGWFLKYKPGRPLLVHKGKTSLFSCQIEEILQRKHFAILQRTTSE